MDSKDSMASMASNASTVTSIINDSKTLIDVSPNTDSKDTKENEKEPYFCVWISSTINPSPVGLSYSATRSVFTWSDRLEQTCNTIRSIRANLKAGTYKIVCLDNSPVLDVAVVQEKLYVAGLDCFAHNHTNNANSIFKAKGEASNTMSFINFFIESKQKQIDGLIQTTDGLEWSKFTHILKISGRYELTAGFSIVPFLSKDKFVFFPSGGSVCTVVYSIPIQSLWGRWVKTMATILLDQEPAFEQRVFVLTKDVSFYLPGKLGAKGLVAVNGEAWSA